jgi:hypothetical protein
VYPFIDPKVHYDAQTFAGKVVLITGASRDIGLETALHFARAGASLTIVARKQEALDASRDTILRERPSARVLTFPADVRDVKKAEDAIAATVAQFGRLDILVANAAALRPSFQRDCPFLFPLAYFSRVCMLTCAVSFRKRGPEQMVGGSRSEYSRDVQFSSVSSVIIDPLMCGGPVRSRPGCTVLPSLNCKRRKVES